MKNVVRIVIVVLLSTVACSLFAHASTTDDVQAVADIDHLQVRILQKQDKVYRDASGNVIQVYAIVHTVPLDAQIASWDISRTQLNEKLAEAYRSGHCDVVVKDDQPVYSFSGLWYKIYTSYRYTVTYDTKTGFICARSSAEPMQHKHILWTQTLLRYLPLVLIGCVFFNRQYKCAESARRMPFGIFCAMPVIFVQIAAYFTADINITLFFALIIALINSILLIVAFRKSIMEKCNGVETIFLLITIAFLAAMHFSHSGDSIHTFSNPQLRIVDSIYFSVVGIALFLFLVLLQRRDRKLMHKTGESAS